MLKALLSATHYHHEQRPFLGPLIQREGSSSWIQPQGQSGNDHNEETALVQPTLPFKRHIGRKLGETGDGFFVCVFVFALCVCL